MTTPYQPAEAWLRDHAQESVLHLLPAARRKGHEMLAASLDGGEGESLHITISGPKTGLWKDFANGEKGSKKLVTLWKAVRQIAPDDHQTFFAQLAAFSGQYFGYEPPGGPIDWQRCLADWTQADADKLCKLRGYSREFVSWLHDVNRGVGVQYGRLVFPVIAPDGTLKGLHRYIDEERLLKFSKGTKVHPMIFGDQSGPITGVHVHESRWDCYALADATGWHLQAGVRFLCTLGAGNGRLVKGQIPPDAKVYCWEQHDRPDPNGKIPNLDWFKTVAANAGSPILKVEIPPEHKDLNDWTRAATVTELDLDGAREAAQPFGTNRTEVSSSAAAAESPPEPASKLFPSPEERPCYRVYDTAFEDDGRIWAAGVYLHALEEKTVRGETTIRIIDRWITSVVRVLAITRTKEGKEHSYLLEYAAHGENLWKREVMPQSLLVGRITDLMQFLRPLGISAMHENAELIRDYLDHEHRKFSAEHPEHFLETVKGAGWYSPGKTFVLPTEIIGDQTGVWFDGKNVACYGKAGDFDTWKKEVATRCEGNAYLMVGLCCALAGPLLQLLNIPGLGLHFYETSTIGKTTALVIGASAWGSGATHDEKQFMRVWNATLNGLESAGVNHSSAFLALDESDQVPDAKVLNAAVYMLLNGTGKSTMHKDRSARETAHWHPCLLSSGERSIETHQTTARVEHKVGQMVRIIDVPVVLGPHGLFQNLHGAEGGGAFSNSLRDMAATHYGHAGPLFVQHLIKNYAALKLPDQLRSILKQFGSDLNAQDARVSRSFALIALAGELAIEWNILPWKKNSALIAATEIFNHWLSTQPQGVKNKETAQLLRSVREFIETRGADFSNADWVPQLDEDGRIKNPIPVVHERAGYWKEEYEAGDNCRRIYCLTSAGLARASGSFGVRKAAEILDDAGALFKREKDKLSHNLWVAELQAYVRCYWVDPEKLADF
jgi:putative DNA primase/helicase